MININIHDVLDAGLVVYIFIAAYRSYRTEALDVVTEMQWIYRFAYAYINVAAIIYIAQLFGLLEWLEW